MRASSNPDGPPPIMPTCDCMDLPNSDTDSYKHLLRKKISNVTLTTSEAVCPAKYSQNLAVGSPRFVLPPRENYIFAMKISTPEQEQCRCERSSSLELDADLARSLCRNFSQRSADREGCAISEIKTLFDPMDSTKQCSRAIWRGCESFDRFRTDRARFNCLPVFKAVFASRRSYQQ